MEDKLVPDELMACPVCGEPVRRSPGTCACHGDEFTDDSNRAGSDTAANTGASTGANTGASTGANTGANTDAGANSAGFASGTVDLVLSQAQAEPGATEAQGNPETPQPHLSGKAASEANESLFLKPGRLLDNRYEVISVLGKGGMGSVYKVREVLLNKLFALKVMHAEKTTEDAFKRFMLEAETESRISHLNCVSIHDFAVSRNGVPYIVMEFLEGSSLSSLLKKEGRFQPDRFFKVMKPICDVLFHAHQLGIIHRDLKPANIMICKQNDGGELVKVLDFGMAKLMKREGSEVPERITATGEVVGSPSYMSPEQCRGEELDPRSDIYSLGVLMHEILTGEPVFKGGTAFAIMIQHVSETAEFKAGVSVLEELRRLVLKCLAKNPAERCQTVQELSQELDRISELYKRATLDFAGRSPSALNKPGDGSCKADSESPRAGAGAGAVVNPVSVAVGAVFFMLFAAAGVSLLAEFRAPEFFSAPTPVAGSVSKTAPELYRSAVLHREQGQNEAAIAELSQAILLENSFLPAIESRAQLYAQRGNFSAAIADYDRLISFQPNSARFYAARAGLQNKMGQFSKSISDCKQSLKLYPEDYNAWIILARSQSELGHHAQALAAFSRAIELQTELAAEYGPTYSDRAKEYLHLKQYKQALQDLAKASRLDPENAETRALFQQCSQKVK